MDFIYFILDGFLKMNTPVLELEDVSRHTTGEVHLPNALRQDTTDYGCLETGKKS